MSLENESSNPLDFEIKPLHCGISVPDIEKSIAWYSDVLKFRLESDVFMAPLNARVAFLKHGQFSVELFEIADAAPLPAERRIPDLDIQTHGTKHIAFSVKNIHRFIDHLKEKKVDIALDVFLVKQDWVAYIRDNSGNLIEFIQQPDQ